MPIFLDIRKYYSVEFHIYFYAKKGFQQSAMCQFTSILLSVWKLNNNVETKCVCLLSIYNVFMSITEYYFWGEIEVKSSFFDSSKGLWEFLNEIMYM